MHNPVKVSVIIPFFDRLDWTRQAIQSVLDQRFADFEILLVDDHSADPAAADLCIVDPRIRYFRQPENRGPAAARNRGLSEARGELIAFLDSDDLFHPDKLARQVIFMDAHPIHVMSHTSYTRIDAAGTPGELMPSGTFQGKVYPRLILACPIATPTVMLRRALLPAELRFPEDRRIGEDIFFWIHLLRVNELLGIADSLTFVRMHGENAALSVEAQKQFCRQLRQVVVREDPSLRTWMRWHTFRLYMLSILIRLPRAPGKLMKLMGGGRKNASG